MARINTISKRDLSQHTVKEMRQSIAKMIKQANSINVLSGDDAINKANSDYFLKDFHINTRGGFTADFNYYHRGKTELRTLYNELAGYINSDISSFNPEERAKEKFIAYVNGFDPEDERNISPEDAEEMFNLKSVMPELFDSQDWFYQDVVVAYSDQRNSLGQMPKSVLQIALEEKKKLQHSNKSYTPEQLKRNIIKGIQTAQSDERRTYNSNRKKDRKSARLNRKAKRKH